jgi:hypothetical protein
MTMKALQALAMTLALASCATTPPYQPASSNYGYGYSDQRLEQNRFRVSFNGDSTTERDQVEDFLLYRSAELTLQSGYDYFVIADRGTDTKRQYDNYGSSFRAYMFPRYYYSPRFGWLPYYDPFWDEPSHIREVTRYRASAEIAMYKGQKPASDAHAFDARDVQQNLAGRVMPPPAPRG